MRKENDRGNYPFIKKTLTLGLALAVTACGGGRYERTRANNESSSAVPQVNENKRQTEKGETELTKMVTELAEKWVNNQEITTKVKMLSYSEGYALYKVSLEYLKTDKFGDQLYFQTDSFSTGIFPKLSNIEGQIKKELNQHQEELNSIKDQLTTR